MAKYENGFECDKTAKVYLKDLIENVWFSACTIIYDEENDMDEYAPIDVIFTAYTRSNNNARYAIELKERKGYGHTDYEDWMIEQPKMKKLKEYNDCGYRSLYFNLFNDGFYYLWDYPTMNSKHTIKSYMIKPHTQGNDNEVPVQKQRIMINSKDCIKSGRIEN